MTSQQIQKQSQKAQKMKSGKKSHRNVSAKHPPVNINISFNINPKNIVSQQNTSSTNIMHKIFHPDQSKNKHSYSNHYSKDSPLQYQSPRTERKEESCRDEKSQDRNKNASKKQIQNLKKKLFNKINNLDIVFTNSQKSCEQEIHRKDEPSFSESQSLMSEKLQKISILEEMDGEEGSAEFIQTLKSKQLPYNYGQSISFQKNNNLSHSYQKSDLLSVVSETYKFPRSIKNHKNLEKKEPCKSKNSQKYVKFKHKPSLSEMKEPNLSLSKVQLVEKKKRREIDLIKKLQKFRIDINQLITYYGEQDEITQKINTDFYYQSSKEINPNPSPQIIIHTDHDLSGLNLKEIHHLEKSYQIHQEDRNHSIHFKEEDNHSINFKDIYQNLKRNQAQEDQIEENTEGIIQYYVNSLKKDSHQLQNIDFIDELRSRDEEFQQINLELNQIICLEDGKIKRKALRKEEQLQELLQLVQNGINNSQITKEEILKSVYQKLKIIHQLTENHNEKLQKESQVKSREDLLSKRDEDKIEIKDEEEIENMQDDKRSIDLSEIDAEINKKYRKLIMDERSEGVFYKMKERSSESAHVKQQIINTKALLWQNYNKIYDLLHKEEEKNHFIKERLAKTDQKQRKMMKCLSQSILNRKYKQTYTNNLHHQHQPKSGEAHQPAQSGELEEPSQQAIEPEGTEHQNNRNGRVRLQRNDRARLQRNDRARLQRNDRARLQRNDRVRLQRNDQQRLEEIESYFHESEQSNNEDENFLIAENKIEFEEFHINGITPVTDTFQFQLLQVPVNQFRQFNQLCTEDKDDIFEFIFLDLCIELFQEAVQIKQSDSEICSNQLQPQPQLQLQLQLQPQIKIIKTINNFIKNQQNSKKPKLGFPTSLQAVKTYLLKLSIFLLDDSNIKYLQKLNLPLGPTEQEMLKSLRIDVIEHKDQQNQDQFFEEQNQMLILPQETFLEFQHQCLRINEMQFQTVFSSEEKEKERVQFLRNCVHIHDKAIFDCLNQNLDCERAFGLWGKPFAWKQKSSFLHIKDKVKLEGSLRKSIEKTTICSSFVCGILVDKEESLIRPAAGQQYYIEQIQDQRVYKLLQHYILEVEGKWFFHDDEQAEILIEISHIVWVLLVKEAIKEILLLKQ